MTDVLYNKVASKYSPALVQYKKRKTATFAPVKSTTLVKKNHKQQNKKIISNTCYLPSVSSSSSSSSISLNSVNECELSESSSSTISTATISSLSSEDSGITY